MSTVKSNPKFFVRGQYVRNRTHKRNIIREIERVAPFYNAIIEKYDTYEIDFKEGMKMWQDVTMDLANRGKFRYVVPNLYYFRDEFQNDEEND